MSLLMAKLTEVRNSNTRPHLYINTLIRSSICIFYYILYFSFSMLLYGCYYFLSWRFLLEICRSRDMQISLSWIIEFHSCQINDLFSFLYSCPQICVRNFFQTEISFIKLQYLSYLSKLLTKLFDQCCFLVVSCLTSINQLLLKIFMTKLTKSLNILCQASTHPKFFMKLAKQG